MTKKLSATSVKVKGRPYTFTRLTPQLIGMLLCLMFLLWSTVLLPQTLNPNKAKRISAESPAAAAAGLTHLSVGERLHVVVAVVPVSVHSL
jgi:hypothetical protein